MSTWQNMAAHERNGPAPEPAPGASLYPKLICACLILLFAVFFSVLAVQQHRAFLTNGLDVGNVDQALWNTAQGRFLHFTLMAPVQSRLALHVEPILLLLVPFYWLRLGGPELLLGVQASVVAVGAWPLYHLSLRVLRNSLQTSSLRWLALIFPLTYLLLPTLQSATLFEFHAVTLASTFLLYAFLALEQKDNRRFFFFAVLAMACKEDMPLTVAMLGLYAGLAQRRWRSAGLTISISAIWFVIVFFVVQPQFAVDGNIQLDRYAWLGSNPIEMLLSLLTRPGLVFDHLWNQVDLPAYLATLFFPTAFLALFSPLTLLPMLPSLAVNLLSDNPFTWRLEDFHYGAPLAPFLFISAIYGVGHITRWASRTMLTPLSPSTRTSAARLVTLLSLLLLTCSIIYHYHRGFTPLARPFIWPQTSAHHRQLKSIAATIPAETPLFTQSNLAPHLSQRAILYSDFAYFTDPEFPAAGDVTDILLDITTLENIGGLHQLLQSTLLEHNEYELKTAQDGILHFQAIAKNSQAALTPSISESLNLQPPFYTFTRPTARLDHPVQIDFDDTVRLHGYSLHFNRQEEVQVTVDFEALQPLDTVQPVLYLLDAQGRPLGATVDVQPALVWFPMEQWLPGQTVRVRFNTLPWHTRQTPTYRLGLGMITGSDVWDTSRRLRPTVSHSTDLAVRLPADGTLIELATIKQLWQIPVGYPQERQFAQPILSQNVQASFGNQIALLSFAPPSLTTPASANPDEVPALSISLIWQAQTSPEPLIRFVQLVGPDGQLYGQQDSAPDFGTYPTSVWQTGEVVAETVILPIQPERPSGDYTLHIGLYRPATGERLLLATGADHVEIAVSKRF